MTGHAHDNQRQPKHGADGLNALVAQIRRDRQGRNPHLVPLEGYEAEIINLFTREYPGHGYRDAGTTLLILGQLFVDWVTKMPEAMQRQAPALIINMMRMIGQRLYDGDLPPIGLTCPFHYVHGAKCKYLAEGADATRIDAAMRAHVGLHHPDNEWPCEHRERITEDGVTAMCTACREVVSAVVGELECEPEASPVGWPELAPGTTAETVSVATFVNDGAPAERIDPPDCVHPKHARMTLPGGRRCAACGSKDIDKDENADAPAPE
jgi:hypothetical protein